MWSDNETGTDLLQFQYLASAVTQIATTPALLPTTIGVFGDWGSGKSSLLKMIQVDLATKGDDILCLSFSGWLFEGYEDAKTALIGSILEAIKERAEQDKPLTEKGKELLQKLIKRVNWMRLTTLGSRYALPALAGHPKVSAAFAGFDMAKSMYDFVKEKVKPDEDISLEDIQKLLKEAPETPESARRSIRDFHRDFETLIKEADLKVLVVFIDDLDRCLPDTIIETLEAIKLFLFAPGTAFIIGADERLVQYAVRRRFPELPGPEVEVGRDYLEKLIQFPIRIPSLNSADIESYIGLLFAQNCLEPEQFGSICQSLPSFKRSNISDRTFDVIRAKEILGEPAVTSQLQEDLVLTAQVAHVLTPGLAGNPRRTKRFLNALLLRMHMAEYRGVPLERPVLAKLMLLEYLKPEFFKQIANLQASQSGKPKEIREAEKIAGASQAPEEHGPESPNENNDTEAGVDTHELAPRSKQESAKGNKAKHSSKPASDLSQDAQTWLADGWMATWLGSLPSISNIDLGPYFHVAHDKLGVLDISPLRLSPAASAILNQLLDEQDITRKLGLSASAELTNPDAVAIFEQVAERLRHSGRSEEAALHKILFAFSEVRKELIPQLIAMYSSLPETKLALSVPVQMTSVILGTPSAEAGRQLLVKWNKSPEPRISRAAGEALQRIDS